MGFSVRGTCCVPGEALGGNCVPLPEGWPLLVDQRDQSIVEPVFEYLRASYLTLNVGREKTVWSYADDLRDWWGFLHHEGIEWDSASLVDLARYRDVLSSVYSPVTGKPFAGQTIGRRVGTVRRFYLWASRRDMLPVPWKTTEVVGGGRNHWLATNFPDGERHPVAADERVIAIPPEKIRKILNELAGPHASFPSDLSRDALAVEIMWRVGLRVSEVVGLHRSDFDIDLACFRETARIPVRIIRGAKGGRSRVVLFPVDLVARIKRFIFDLQSHESLTPPPNGVNPPKHLFLSSRKTGGRSVGALSYKSLWASINSAVLRSGFVRREERMDLSSGLVQVVDVAEITPHQFRHTFAVNEYLARKQAGDPDPIRAVQALLGHSRRETTERIYLRVCQTYEARVGEAFVRYMDVFDPDS